ncbi:MAG: hypothetical protein U0X40_04540 [Ferruginibacter sp.]
MKKIVPLTALMGLTLVFGSCSTSKDSLATADNEAYATGKENTASCFIQKKDGSIIRYQSLRLVNSVFNSAYLLADGSTRIYGNDIRSYQTRDYFAVSQAQFVNGRKSHVSTECLPGFAVRIARGKLNVYCKKFYNGSRAVNEYYLQQGEDGKIQVYSAGVFLEMIKENAAATAFFTNGHKMPLMKKIQGTAAIINAAAPDVTKN